MNEEEKQAIAYLKFYIERDVMYEDTHYMQIRILLNLIEKQQKEIERLEKKLKRYQKYLRDAEKKCDKLLEFEYTERERDYISKDKIKEKIEELKNRKIGASTGIFAVQVDILEELLRG